MQINLRDSGTFIFLSDHAHVMENVSPSPFSHVPFLASKLLKKNVLCSIKVSLKDTWLGIMPGGSRVISG